MDTKHTPGPWTILSEKTGSVGSDAPYKMTASVYGDHEECEPDGRMLANARLIAAAPELLESLRNTASMLQSACLVITDKEARQMALETVAEARAAIAKATGQ